MKKADLPYSLKNIPIPSKSAYLKSVISRTTEFIQRMRWKAYYFTKPKEQSDDNASRPIESFGFKTTRSAPDNEHLNAFEDDLVNLISNLEFDNKLSGFQKQLNKDVKQIHNSTNLYVPADKTPNVYTVSKQTYEQLLNKNITAHYTKDRDDTENLINKEASGIANKLNIADRVQVMTNQQCYVTLKDHKDNFMNDPKCRLINPAKSQIGRIAKQKLQHINNHIRLCQKLQQWRSTDSVLKWFNDIEFKTRKQFLQLDIEEFYPSISVDLFTKALTWASSQYTITSDDYNIIMNASKSLLFSQGVTWKKTSGLFDITMGAFHGAEVCELVGLFLLNEMQTNFPNLNFGLYRDDGLGVHRRLSGPDLERIKKQIISLFKSHSLNITIQTNLRIVNFLDVTLNLNDETFAPYRKPNSAPLYINVQSNHPPYVLKKLPSSVSKRISQNSCNSTVFEESASEYNRALAESGYKEKVVYQKSTDNSQGTKRTRTRHIVWYNPPYNKALKTNLGRKFLDLVDRHFSKSNPLSRIFNRNTLKIGYSCTKNMKAIIQGHNNKVISSGTNISNNEKPCNCTKSACPLNGTCLADRCVIYQATVEGPQSEQKKSTLASQKAPSRHVTLGTNSRSPTKIKKKPQPCQNMSGTMNYSLPPASNTKYSSMQDHSNLVRAAATSASARRSP